LRALSSKNGFILVFVFPSSSQTTYIPSPHNTAKRQMIMNDHYSSSSPKGGSYAPSVSSTTATESMSTNSSRPMKPGGYRTSSNSGNSSSNSSAYPFHYLQNNHSSASPKARSQPGLSSPQDAGFLAHVNRFAAMEQKYSMSEVNAPRSSSYSTTPAAARQTPPNHHNTRYSESSVSDRIRQYQESSPARSHVSVNSYNSNSSSSPNRSAALAAAADNFRARQQATVTRSSYPEHHRPPNNGQYSQQVPSRSTSMPARQSPTAEFTTDEQDYSHNIDTPAPATVQDLKRQLWDEGNRLQVPVAPRGSYLDGTDQLFSDKVTTRRQSLHDSSTNNNRQTFRRDRLHSRSLSPARRQQFQTTTAETRGSAVISNAYPTSTSSSQHQHSHAGGGAQQSQSKLFQSRFYQAAARTKQQPVVVSNLPLQQQQQPSSMARSHSFSERSKPFDEPSRSGTPISHLHNSSSNYLSSSSIQRQNSYGSSGRDDNMTHNILAANESSMYATSTSKQQSNFPIRRQNSSGSGSEVKRYGVSVRPQRSFDQGKNNNNERSSISRVASRDASVERSSARGNYDGASSSNSRDAPSQTQIAMAQQQQQRSESPTTSMQPLQAPPSSLPKREGVTAFWQQKATGAKGGGAEAAVGTNNNVGRPPPSPTMTIRQKPSWVSSVDQQQQRVSKGASGQSEHASTNHSTTSPPPADTAQLLEQLKAVRRDNPADALAQIDRILNQLDAVASKEENNGVDGQRSSMEILQQSAIQDGEQEDEEEEDGDSDDDTSVSSITNPTYASAQIDKVKVQEHGDNSNPFADDKNPFGPSTATYRRPRPSNLQNYSNGNAGGGGGAQVQESRSKQKARLLKEFPPPNTIKVKDSSSTSSPASGQGNAPGHLRNEVRGNPMKQQNDLANKIHKWDDMSNADQVSTEKKIADIAPRPTVPAPPNKHRRHPWDDSIPVRNEKVVEKAASRDTGRGGETQMNVRPRVGSPVNPFDDLPVEENGPPRPSPEFGDPFPTDKPGANRPSANNGTSTLVQRQESKSKNPFNDDSFFSEEKSAKLATQNDNTVLPTNPFNDDSSFPSSSSRSKQQDAPKNPFGNDGSRPKPKQQDASRNPFDSPESQTRQQDAKRNHFTEDASLSKRGSSSARSGSQSASLYRRQKENAQEAADAFDQAWATFPEAVSSHHTRSLDAVHSTPPRPHVEDIDMEYPSRPVVPDSSSNPFDDVEQFENHLSLLNSRSSETDIVEEPGIEVSLIEEGDARMNSSSLLDCEIPETKEKRLGGIGRLFKRKDKSKGSNSTLASGRSGPQPSRSTRPTPQLPMIPAPALPEQKEAPPPRGRLGLRPGAGMGRSRSASLTKPRFGKGYR
jgi:hypothetical protein